MADGDNIGESTYKFNMAVETLMRLNRQLYVIWDAKAKGNPGELYKHLVILEQELSPFLPKLRNYKDELVKMATIKVKIVKYLKVYNSLKQLRQEGSGGMTSQLNDFLGQYDAMLRRYMQELRLLMVEAEDTLGKMLKEAFDGIEVDTNQD